MGKISELNQNLTNITLLSHSCVQKKDKNGNPYVEFTLTDGEKTISAKKFNTSTFEVSDCIAENTVVDCEITYNTPYYNLSSIKKSASQNIKDFVRSTPIDENEMFDFIVSAMQEYVENEGSISNIGIILYEKYKSKLLNWSASKSMHHNMMGGLLYHIYRMVLAANKLMEIYQPIDGELLITSIALHDIGKLVELDTNEVGVASYTNEGELFGHLEIGIEMVDFIARKGEYDKEKTKLLKHCIASHHGTREFGAIQVPRIKEAFLLSKIDDMDAKIYMFDSIYNELEPGKFEEKAHYGLDAKIYRPEFTKDTEYKKYI